MKKQNRPIGRLLVVTISIVVLTAIFIALAVKTSTKPIKTYDNEYIQTTVVSYETYNQSEAVKVYQPTLRQYIESKCVEYGLDYEVVCNLITVESNWNEKEISKTYDYGLFQINKVNHSWLTEQTGCVDYLDGFQNTDAGLYLLNKLYSKYGDWNKVLMAYNLGEKGAERMWKKGIYSTEYSRKVMKK